jgi:hypothetical protein
MRWPEYFDFDQSPLAFARGKQITNEGRPAAALVERLGWMAAAGCDPCLSFAGEHSGKRQVHFVFRCGQCRPQRQNHDSPARLVVEPVDAGAPLAKPEMPHRM